MAPPRLYQLPNEQLVELLSTYRTEGLSFEAAWELAVRPKQSVVMTNTRALPKRPCVLWPTDSSDRMAWRGAILELKDEYRRAYQRRPATKREAAAGLLITVLLNASDRRAWSRGIGERRSIRSAV